METQYIADILYLLVSAILVVPLFQRLGLSAVLGFLVAGALIGPWGLGFIVAVEEIRHLAEFGVVFLLFVIGIELKPSRLWVMRRTVFGLGTAQVLLTGIVITLIALSLGLDTRSAILVGFGLALSSTAFGLQLLSDKGELGVGYGRAALAVLLLQDLAIVPLMALLPLLAQRDLSITQDVELAALESVLIIVGVFVLGRLLLRPLLQLVAGSRKNPEIFTAAGILLVLGAAWLTDWAGLSMALGAFLGGLLLADSRYRHQIMADIQPFRGLLLGLFFMSVGMSINFGLLKQQVFLVVGLVGGLLLLKVVLLWLLCRILGRSQRDSIQVALLLAQAGEFGFILFGLSHTLGVMEAELYQLLLLVVALSMAATPILVKLGPWADKALMGDEEISQVPTKTIPAESNRVIIAGFGRFGNYLARSLGKAGIKYLVLEINPNRVARAQALDYPVYFGDASQVEVLRVAGADGAKMVIFAMDHMESIGQAVVAVREAFPDLPIYTRAWDARMVQRLLSLGATYAIPETMPTAVQFTRDVLRASGVSEQAATQLVNESYDRERRESERTAATDKEGFRHMVLILTPGKDQAPLLSYAATLAADNRSTLTVAEILTENLAGMEEGVSSPDELEEHMVESCRRRLEEMISRLTLEIDVQTKVLVGKPHEAITREVVSNGWDLVLKAAEDGNRLKERLFGNNDSRLWKTCPCPVLLIRSIPPKPYRHRRICVGIYQDEHPGGSRSDRHMMNHSILEHAAWLASAQFAELHIVHVWEAYGEKHLRSGRSPLHFEVESYVASEQQRNRAALDASLSELNESMNNNVMSAFKPVCHLVKGSHQNEIIRMASSMNADLVVVGGIIHSGISGLIVDSTAEAVAKNVDCSVLIIKG
ncbi:monovalent cation:proton antiporter-2 (CPA2) family protein [Pseudomonadota bacterium]